MATFEKKYNPNRSADWNFGGAHWKLSRSKLELYLECPRCFYIDNKLGTARPRGPAFTLNIAVDTLLKREFDIHRSAQTVHPLIQKNSLPFVPFAHKDIDVWRDNFSGLTHAHEATGLTISGAVDDIWTNLQTDELFVVDYKTTSKENSVTSLSDSSWEDQYKRQMGVYQWLLRKKGFKVSTIGYFVYANARAKESTFEDDLHFETTLIPSEGDDSWIDSAICKAHECLMSDAYPKESTSCEFCAYRGAAGKKLQSIYASQTKK